jgi:hypothetical protein
MFLCLFVYLYSICILVFYALLTKDLKLKSTEQKNRSWSWFREKQNNLISKISGVSKYKQFLPHEIYYTFQNEIYRKCNGTEGYIE